MKKSCIVCHLNVANDMSHPTCQSCITGLSHTCVRPGSGIKSSCLQGGFSNVDYLGYVNSLLVALSRIMLV